MNWIFALQKELGSIVGLPEDMQHVRNAMIILSEARKEQKSAEAAAQQPAQAVAACTCHEGFLYMNYDCPVHWNGAGVA